MKEFCLKRISALATTFVLVGFPSLALHAQLCPAAQECRAIAPNGALLHHPNHNGFAVWTTPCGPNTNSEKADPICSAITRCPGAGGFGKFLSAVTFQCSQKHFDSYYGLDGMTFGILDWTSENLPGVLNAYHQRAPEGFDATFGALHLPMKNECLDTKWVCNENKNARLMCDASFHSAFKSALQTPQFQKAEIDYARLEYEQRLNKFKYLGFQTEYGNTAMAVVDNNLRGGIECAPTTWKAACKGKALERDVIQCMLDQYVYHGCRGTGDKNGAAARARSIEAAFSDGRESTNIDPTTAEIEECAAPPKAIPAAAPTPAPEVSNNDAQKYAEGLIKPWTSASCAPPRLDFPRWVGYPVTKCAYSDIGATVQTYMLNADRSKLARWTVTACRDAKAVNMQACVKYLTDSMSAAASFSVFPVAGYIPEPESGGLCYLFRDGVTVKTAIRPHFAKPVAQTCGDNDRENEAPLIWAGLYARVASTTREDYLAVHPGTVVAGLQWVDITRIEYQKAWNSDRNELLSVKAIHARNAGTF